MKFIVWMEPCEVMLRYVQMLHLKVHEEILIRRKIITPEQTK